MVESWIQCRMRICFKIHLHSCILCFFANYRNNLWVHQWANLVVLTVKSQRKRSKKSENMSRKKMQSENFHSIIFGFELNSILFIFHVFESLKVFYSDIKLCMVHFSRSFNQFHLILNLFCNYFVDFIILYSFMIYASSYYHLWCFLKTISLVYGSSCFSFMETFLISFPNFLNFS